VKFYVSALVGVIIKVTLQNARCNSKDSLFPSLDMRDHVQYQPVKGTGRTYFIII